MHQTVFVPRRSLTIEVDGGGPWRHGDTPSGLGPSHKARHALDADGAGRNYPASTHVRLVWLAAQIAVDARVPVRMLPSSPGDICGD
jgi:hypothetical protein